MYSNSKNGFSLLDLLVKIIFAALFIFVLVWLFNKKIPNYNLTPFYSNVFRENIKYMQEAGESYFTDDKMPQEIGDTIKISLAEMEEKKLILPFVDKDGKVCNKQDSYVSVTKLTEGYELKTNLVCDTESNYVSKYLGCHTYCKDKECNKTCSLQKITEYQYKKLVKGSKTNYSCPSGYKLSGKNCIKTIVKDTRDATVSTQTTTTVTKPANIVKGDAELTQLKVSVADKKVLVTTNTSDKKTTVPSVTTDGKTAVNVVTGSKKVYVETIKTPVAAKTKTEKQAYDCSTTESVRESYNCTKYKTSTQCSTSYQQQGYSCNCKTTTSGGRSTTTCSTCYTSVPVQSCHDVTTSYTDTCYRDTTKKVPKTCYKDVTVTVSEASTSYSCPSGTTAEGSGSSLKCYKTEKTYSCPSGATSEGSGSSLKCYTTGKSYSCPSGTTAEGSGSSLKCYKTEKVYSCPSGTIAEGSGSSLKCYKTEKVYSCPTGTTDKEGSGESLKCYKVTEGSVSYTCESGYTLSGNTCSKVVKSSDVTYECKDKNYKLEGSKCVLYGEEKKSATSKKVSTSYYTYKWSTEESLSGYTRTGKTRTKDGEVVCQ